MQNLKIFKILEPAGREFLEIVLKDKNLDWEKFIDLVHLQENCLA